MDIICRRLYVANVSETSLLCWNVYSKSINIPPLLVTFRHYLSPSNSNWLYGFQLISLSLSLSATTGTLHLLSAAPLFIKNESRNFMRSVVCVQIYPVLSSASLRSGKDTSTLSQYCLRGCSMTESFVIFLSHCFCVMAYMPYLVTESCCKALNKSIFYLLTFSRILRYLNWQVAIISFWQMLTIMPLLIIMIITIGCWAYQVLILFSTMLKYT